MGDKNGVDENVLAMDQADQLRFQILLRIISYARAMRPEEFYSISLVLGKIIPK